MKIRKNILLLVSLFLVMGTAEVSAQGFLDKISKGIDKASKAIDNFLEPPTTVTAATMTAIYFDDKPTEPKFIFSEQIENSKVDAEKGKVVLKGYITGITPEMVKDGYIMITDNDARTGQPLGDKKIKLSNYIKGTDFVNGVYSGLVTFEMENMLKEGRIKGGNFAIALIANQTVYKQDFEVMKHGELTKNEKEERQREYEEHYGKKSEPVVVEKKEEKPVVAKNQYIKECFLTHIFILPQGE